MLVVQNKKKISSAMTCMLTCDILKTWSRNVVQVKLVMMRSHKVSLLKNKESYPKKKTSYLNDTLGKRSI